MSRCYRCSMCSSCWPFKPEFDRCPECGSKCWSKAVQSGDDVPTDREAKRIKRQTDFEDFCSKADEKRVQEEIDYLASADVLYPEDVVKPEVGEHE